MVKTMLCVGARKKCDSLIYLAYAITKQNKRVLIVDHTQNQNYRLGYVRLAGDEYLYDLQGVDILVGTDTWIEVEEVLKMNNETTVNYDFILFDVDSEQSLEHDWPEIDEYLYIGDFERDNIQKDANVINGFVQKASKSVMFRRMTILAKYNMNEDLIENYLNNVKWNSVHMEVHSDELMDNLRLTIQHQQIIPYEKLTKQYREVIEGFVSELFLLHIKDVQEVMKPSLLARLFGRKNGKKNTKNDTENVRVSEDLILRK